jgi:diadenosine tetraphosphate (Ap4A) HIT family hydrolase
MENLPIPPQEAIIYESEKLYVCLASFPLAKGHTVVVWKDVVRDLHSLDKVDFEYLMDIVDIARNVLMEVYGVDKVYLLYMDEIEHIHWHLVPRFDEKGFNVLSHAPTKLDDFSLVGSLRKIFLQKKTDYEIGVNLKNR